MMKALRNICWTTLCVVALGVVPVQAQQQSQNQQQSSDQAAAPIPAYRSPLASAADNGDSDSANDNSDQLAPDNRSLAGPRIFHWVNPRRAVIGSRISIFLHPPIRIR